jgi:hypothetical protein
VPGSTTTEGDALGDEMRADLDAHIATYVPGEPIDRTAMLRILANAIVTKAAVFKIRTTTVDPASPAPGDIWLRTDL